MRILIIEDDEVACRSMCRVLEQAGHTTRCASTGAEGVRLLMADTPELLVLDLLLGPGVSGWDVAKFKRADPRLRAVPYVVVSGVPASDIRASGLLNDAHPVVLSKPVKADLLLKVIADCAGRAAAVEELPPMRERAISAHDIAAELAPMLEERVPASNRSPSGHHALPAEEPVTQQSLELREARREIENLRESLRAQQTAREKRAQWWQDHLMRLARRALELILTAAVSGGGCYFWGHTHGREAALFEVHQAEPAPPPAPPAPH
jgi:CheY-like chemotaxis protein